MDYQASASSSKIVLFFSCFSKKLTSLVFLFAVVPLLFVHAQVIENPASRDISVSAEVLQKYLGSPTNFNPGPLGPPPIPDAVILQGLAYPNSTITVLRNGTQLAQVSASASGVFDIHIQNVNQGTHSFGLRAQDKNGSISKLTILSVFVTPPETTVLSGIFIPPTVTSDKIEVKKGDVIKFSGFAPPNAEIRLSFDSTIELLKRTQADSTGSWSYAFNSQELALGNYNVRARAITASATSQYSDELPFRIGDVNRFRTKLSELTGFRKRCDLNNDNKVNLLDFSIMAFWYKRLGFPKLVDLNSDNAINLTDLSILAYCWTG